MSHVYRPRDLVGYCPDCPDREGCMIGYPCSLVRSIAAHEKPRYAPGKHKRFMSPVRPKVGTWWLVAAGVAWLLVLVMLAWSL